MAVLKRDLDSAKNLLEKKGKSINVNAIDSRSGYTPLIQALVNKEEEMVKFGRAARPTTHENSRSLFFVLSRKTAGRQLIFAV